MQPGASAPSGVCERSELFLPPRAAFSRLSGGAVRVMDHDCPWVARCIGGNNHATFVGMLVLGELAIVLSFLTMYNSRPLLPMRSWAQALGGSGGVCVGDGTDARCVHELERALAHARLVLSAVPLLLLLLLVLTPLVITQLYLATVNVTTREHFAWARNVQASHGKMPMFPFPGTQHFRLYSPNDRGVLRNWAAFAYGARDQSPNGPGSGAGLLEQCEPEATPMHILSVPEGMAGGGLEGGTAVARVRPLTSDNV